MGWFCFCYLPSPYKQQQQMRLTWIPPRTGGQIGNNDSADDVLNVDLSKIHYLTGPFEIEGAQPGDLLLVEIMDVQPFQVSTQRFLALRLLLPSPI
jgi:hypothetical protein